jgi:hypothetical protein
VGQPRRNDRPSSVWQHWGPISVYLFSGTGIQLDDYNLVSRRGLVQGVCMAGELTFLFLEPLVGGVPVDPGLVERHMEMRSRF